MSQSALYWDGLRNVTRIDAYFLLGHLIVGDWDASRVDEDKLAQKIGQSKAARMLGLTEEQVSSLLALCLSKSWGSHLPVGDMCATLASRMKLVGLRLVELNERLFLYCTTTCKYYSARIAICLWIAASKCHVHVRMTPHRFRDVNEDEPG